MQVKKSDSIKLKGHVLKAVEKPARYLGNEYNSCVKDANDVNIRFAFCFPDIYEIGMSHLGMKILYHLINERDDTYCERVFMPWTDMMSMMKIEKIPLFTLETKTPVNNFDIVGFTLQYEMAYTNVLAMLDMSGIELYSKDRKKGDPIVIAGGPCAYNIEPMADFFDIAFVGESEEQMPLFLDIFNEYKKDNTYKKEDFLKNVAKNIKGAYVPSLYDILYNDDETINSITPKSDDIPRIVEKAIVMDMDNSYYPKEFIVPSTEIIHDRAFLEVFRGCSRGCRFCQAGFTTRPVREKSSKTLLQQAKDIQDKTGYDEIGLLSLSTGDYSQIKEFSHELLCQVENTNTGISLPSLRVDSFSLDLMEKAQKTRKSGLTFAPEAGTDRLRDVINKNISHENIINSMKLAFAGGWSTVKLYFMIGLPTETDEDIEGIGKLVKEIENLYYSTPKDKRAKKLSITVSAAIFVPKPFTPFQWEPQEELDSLLVKQNKLRGLLKSRNVKFLWHGGKESVWEAVLARGDRRLGKILYKAYKKGQIFDSWNEFFNFSLYEELMKENGLSIPFYANRSRTYEEVLPWDHIDIGVRKEFLKNENIKANEQITTMSCMEDCSYCGATKFRGGICFDRADKV